MPQQLVGRIKRTSKYSYQAPQTNGGWFDINFSQWAGRMGIDQYSIRGNNNDYRICDLNFGVRIDNGTVIPLK
jgi:hypothetical protein